MNKDITDIAKYLDKKLKQEEYHDENNRFIMKLSIDNYCPWQLSINIIMLNPSDKDRNKIGSTIRQLLKMLYNIEKTNKFNELTITNLVPYKTSHPNKIDYSCPCFSQHILDNDEYLKTEIEFSDIVILAYGDIKCKKHKFIIKEILKKQDNKIKEYAKTFNKPLYAFGKNKNNTPRHPRSFSYESNDVYSLIKLPFL